MLVLRWDDVSGLKRFEEAVEVLQPPKVMQFTNRAVNRAGDMARTGVRRNLTKQTGLERATIVKAIKVSRSTPQTLTYTMVGAGGEVSLKYFKARETRKGVSASPFGKRKVFEGTFIKGGRFPDRVGLNMGGQVFARVGSGRFPIEKQKSGVWIAKELVQGETARAFEDIAKDVLPRRIAHELSRATGGVLR